MRKSFVVWLSVLSGMFFAGSAIHAETLYFRPQQDNIWGTIGNWFVAGPNNTYVLAGRLPNSADDVEIDDNCNATSTSPQLGVVEVYDRGPIPSP